MEIVDYARETRVARARVLENLYRAMEVETSGGPNRP